MVSRKKTEEAEVGWEDDLEGEIILIRDDRKKTLFRLRTILESKMQQLEIICFLFRGVGKQLERWEQDEKFLLRKKDCWFLMQILMHFSMQKEHLGLLQKEWARRFSSSTLEVKAKQ
jgi:hypothetical protein